MMEIGPLLGGGVGVGMDGAGVEGCQMRLEDRYRKFLFSSSTFIT